MAANHESLLQSLRTKEAVITNLQTQIKIKNSEKQKLDEAVSQLHDNLFRVESSFTKIRKEVAQKVSWNCALSCVFTTNG